MHNKKAMERKNSRNDPYKKPPVADMSILLQEVFLFNVYFYEFGSLSRNVEVFYLSAVEFKIRNNELLTKYTARIERSLTYRLSRNVSRSVFCLGESLENATEISSEFDLSSKNS